MNEEPINPEDHEDEPKENAKEAAQGQEVDDDFGFPVTPYYRGHILDGQTLTAAGVWWTAILLLQDPKTKKPFIGLYRWQKSKTGGWKTRKRFSFKRAAEVKQVMRIMERFAFKLE